MESLDPGGRVGWGLSMDPVSCATECTVGWTGEWSTVDWGWIGAVGGEWRDAEGIVGAGRGGVWCGLSMGDAIGGWVGRWGCSLSGIGGKVGGEGEGIGVGGGHTLCWRDGWVYGTWVGGWVVMRGVEALRQKANCLGNAKTVRAYSQGGVGWDIGTAHSRFKVPLELTEESLCKITKNTHLAKLLADTNLIIWDEAPMNDRCCFEALDRSLRDILNALLSLFGGKSIVFRLKENIRLARTDISVDERNLINSFASWLLDVGDGKIEDSDEEDPENASWIDIPYRYCLSLGEEGLLKLIDFIYDESTLQTPSAVTLQQKAIVCPENETADMINSQVLKAVCGETTTYVSQDKATPVGNDGADTEMLNPVEHLNTLKFSRFPPHKLELKVGAPVMLLRNINLEGGLCNGTRMIVTQLMTKLIEVQIITGMRVG
ncbi:DNA helicase, partial [Tanacetum coccineum]